VLFLLPLQFVCLFFNLSKCVLLFFSCISFISAAALLLASLALIVQVPLPYYRTGRAGVLYDFILVFLRVSAITNSHHQIIKLRKVNVTCIQHDKFGISFVQVIFL
jgi:hypothetical protein